MMIDDETLKEFNKAHDNGIPWDGTEIPMAPDLVAKMERDLAEVERIFRLHCANGISENLAKILAHYCLETDGQIAAKTDSFYIWEAYHLKIDPEILQAIPALANRKLKLFDWMK